MDSLTQIVLGAAVGGAVLAPRQTRRGLVLGAVCGTLPDLDIIVPFPDAVTFFTYHRSVTHSFFYLTLATPSIVLLAMRFAPQLRDTEYARELWELHETGELKPETVLTGVHVRNQARADVDAVLDQIEETRLEAEEREAAYYDSWDDPPRRIIPSLDPSVAALASRDERQFPAQGRRKNRRGRRGR